MWRGKISDRNINLSTRQAWRRYSILVDPQSSIFTRVAAIIETFKNRRSMVVFQPQKNNLTVRLPRFELQFNINHQGLLKSRRLKATVSADHDAGTLYGLASSLVLQDWLIPDDRSVLVAMGPSAEVFPGEGHPKIYIFNTGHYARFFINEIFGCLECASEPRLVYFKAYCHAITSSVMPDPLTGRTGTNQAIHSLQAGNTCPRAPLDEEFYQTLSSMAQLTPRRDYYPEKLKVFQKVSRNEKMTLAIQHDGFSGIVANIMQQCRT